jgi:hypothetical protein
MTRYSTSTEHPTLPFHDSPPIAANSYPDAPGFKSDGPSREAAHAVKAVASTLRARVLDAIKVASLPPTADEIADKLGASILSVRPRCSELFRRGEIAKADLRGRNDSGMSATRWKVAPPLPGGGVHTGGSR